MPDGDIVHPTLSARYYSVYKQVCEGAFNEDELARGALKCLKKDLKENGEEPIQLIEQEATLFERIAAQLQQGIAVDWAQERKQIKALEQQIDGSKQALQLVVRACEQQLRILQMEHHYSSLSCDFFLEVSKRYALNVYDARFAKKVGQTRHHHNQADPDAVRAKLGDIRPLVIKGIDTFASQITQRGNVQVLRLPIRSTRIRMIDIKKDIDRDILELL